MTAAGFSYGLWWLVFFNTAFALQYGEGATRSEEHVRPGPDR